LKCFILAASGYVTLPRTINVTAQTSKMTNNYNNTEGVRTVVHLSTSPITVSHCPATHLRYAERNLVSTRAEGHLIKQVPEVLLLFDKVYLGMSEMGSIKFELWWVWYNPLPSVCRVSCFFKIRG